MDWLTAPVTADLWVWLLMIGSILAASVEWRYTCDRWEDSERELTKWRALGKEYNHPQYGRVILIGFHPWDGACRIVEVTDEHGNDHLVYVERSELTVAGTEAP